ncbi:MAG: hypothetical protein JJU29_03120 [Verrucomicrobia bacterium]|nr:hypothetical protein [Verrucomicrobiota bacterium]MCH8511165.1 hypothetical protein [Kiritimatiellia bacterium]
MNMMKVRNTLGLSLAAILLAFTLGCNSDSKSNDSSYAGNWAGSACGRNLKMKINQDGNNLSGTYTLSDPNFTENFQGTVSSATPPGKATLTAGDGRKFEITFTEFNRFEGTFFNPGPVCAVSAAK